MKPPMLGIRFSFIVFFICLSALLFAIGPWLFGQTNPWGAISKIEPSRDAKELVWLRSYPKETDDGEGDLWQPVDMVKDPQGNIDILDYKANTIQKYNKQGIWLASIGRPGQGFGDLSGPVDLECVAGSLAVVESYTRRLQFFKTSGEPEKIIKLPKPKWSFASSDGELIFVNPMYATSKQREKIPHLIEAVSSDGSVQLQFGAPLAFDWDDYILNKSMIRLDNSGVLWLMFEHFPLLRRYNRDGILIGEYKLNKPIFAEIEKANRRLNAKRPGENPTYFSCAILSQMFEDRLYIMSYVPPRFWIYKIDEKGQITETFWKRAGDDLHIVGMIVMRENNQLNFHVLQNHPAAKVDIYALK